MIEYILYTIFFLSCIVLVAAVLLQPGKTDAGALFTSNVSSAAFGPRGTATVLSKITIVAATVFMLSALLISMPLLTGSSRSVLQAAPETPAETNVNTADSNSSPTAPAGDANTAAPAADTNTAAPAVKQEAPAANEAPANK